MRLLIESRRLTIELASTKVAAADKSNANTLASEREPERPSTDRSSPTKLQDLTGDPVGPKDSSVHQYTQLPRRKSIHKRLGRILLRVSRMCSDVQCSMYAYQHGSGVAELPEGGSPVDMTPSLCEMPGSFPRAELESYGIQTSSAHCRAANRLYEDAAPEHLQNYYKANQNATLRRAAPMSVTNLSQLPRLEVPQSQHCVPRLMKDCSPLTPSPISPITPSTGGYNGQAGLPMHFDTISPCGDSKTSQTYTHYGTWDHLPSMTPATPCATTSCISSLASTPLSAYPSTASSPFYHCPQPQPEVQLPMYSQGLLHPDHAHSPNGTTLRRAFSWQSPAQVESYNSSDTSHSCQMHHYQSNIPAIREPLNSPAHAQSCFEKQDLLARAPPTPISPETQYFFDDIPPAYSPIIADTQPPLTNPQRRYLPSVCQHCGKSFTGKYGPGNCKRHIQQTHETFVDRAIHVCRLCVKSYNRADALRKHQWKKHRLEEAKPRKRRDRGSEQTRVW